MIIKQIKHTDFRYASFYSEKRKNIYNLMCKPQVAVPNSNKLSTTYKKIFFVKKFIDKISVYVSSYVPIMPPLMPLLPIPP